MAAHGIGQASARNVADYSGRSSVAMYAWWRYLSEYANTTARILNAVWTDFAANAVVGTRSWNRDQTHHKKRSDVPHKKHGPDVPINTYRHRVRYKILYGIPAFFALAFMLGIAILTCLMCLFGRVRPSSMRRDLSHTAPGRLMGSFAYPGLANSQTETRSGIRLSVEKRFLCPALCPSQQTRS
ncbi:hypothetical protein VTO42DRAFT_5584 [Malbranchea cinnamomea]